MSGTTRRDFLIGSVAVGAAATGLPALFARAAFGAAPSDRVLVLIQLEGGNDGLNTVVPHGDDAYYRTRPGIAIPRGSVVRLDDRVGLHPGLAPLRTHWDDAQVAVLQGVGYPNPNRSHFESTDIWQTARLDSGRRRTGWAGRALDRCADGEVPAVQLDPGPLSLALAGEKVLVPAIADADRFRVGGDARVRALLEGLVVRPRGDDAAAEYVRRSAQQAYRTAARVEKALDRAAGMGAYPAGALAERLWQIARLVEGGFPARVYAVRLTGFDTHARQRLAHDALMRTLGESLGAFLGDLRAKGIDERVLAMTYSEFGRRVEENRSLGTDHGTAAPMLVCGGAVKAGLHGDHPSLGDLDGGDLRYGIDFRGVYATILDRWIGVDPAEVLGASHAVVGFL